MPGNVQASEELNLNPVKPGMIEPPLPSNAGVMARFGIGAAQFGMSYGRFNTQGMPSQSDVGNILIAARNFGLSLIDTAHEYGASQSVLGLCAEEARHFAMTTKTPRLPANFTAADAQTLGATLRAALGTLRRASVDGLMVHNSDELLAPGGGQVYEQLLALKDAGLVQKIGVSAYTGEVAEQIADRFPIDLVQLPINWLDRRLIESGALRRLNEKGIEIHARSAFLQGLLLADPATLPANFDSVRSVLTAFRDNCTQAGVSPAHAALHHLLGIPEITRIIVGVESIEQLNELFGSFPPPPTINFAGFSCNDVRILNPVLWNA